MLQELLLAQAVAEKLESVTSQLDVYLDAKRTAFVRFFALSNSQLLELSGAREATSGLFL